MNDLSANTPSRHIDLDDTDQAIIQLLRQDGRMAYRAIARELDIAENTVRARVRRMEESNTMRVVAVTDIEAAGYGMLLAIGVQVEGRSPEVVAREMAAIPEVFSVNVVVGAQDIEILVVSRDQAALNELITDKLGAIVERLSRDARVSNREIAEQLGVTEGTVRARVKRMEEEKLIRITAVTNIDRFKDAALAYIWIEVERSGQTKAVAEQLAGITELGFVGVMLGRSDILAITMVRNAEHLAEFVHQRISVVEGVRGAHSTLGVNFIKHDYRMARIVS